MSAGRDGSDMFDFLSGLHESMPGSRKRKRDGSEERELSELTAELNTLSDQNTKNQNIINDLHAEIARLKTVKSQDVINDLRAEVARLQKVKSPDVVNNLYAEMRRLQTTIATNEATIAGLNATLERKTTEYQADKGKVAQLQLQHQNMKQECKNAEDKLFLEQKKSEQHVREVTSQQSAIDELHATIRKLNSEIVDKQNEILETAESREKYLENYKITSDKERQDVIVATNKIIFKLQAEVKSLKNQNSLLITEHQNALSTEASKIKTAEDTLRAQHSQEIHDKNLEISESTAKRRKLRAKYKEEKSSAAELTECLTMLIDEVAAKLPMRVSNSSSHNHQRFFASHRPLSPEASPTLSLPLSTPSSTIALSQSAFEVTSSLSSSTLSSAEALSQSNSETTSSLSSSTQSASSHSFLSQAQSTTSTPTLFSLRRASAALGRYHDPLFSDDKLLASSSTPASRSPF